MSGLRPGAAPFVMPTAAAEGGGGGNDEERRRKLSRLAARFPSFPAASLSQVLDAAGGDVASAAVIVAGIEGSARAAGAAAAAEAAARAGGDRWKRPSQPPPSPASFPALSGGRPGAATAAPHPLTLPPLRRNATNANKFLATSEEEFPSLGAASTKQPKQQQRNKSSKQQEQERLTASFAAAALADDEEAEAAARAAEAAAASRARAPPPGVLAPSSSPSSAVPWVTTGATVSAEYTAARERARALSVARNVAFEQATQAYLRGDKASAKAMSARGKELAEEMRREHEKAAATIFERRNRGESGGSRQPASASSSSSGAALTLDLHGLHVAEGVAAVERAVEGARRRRKERAATATTTQTLLRIVVGVGKHTTHGAGRVARLPLAVKAKLDEMRVPWREAPGAEGTVLAYP